MPCMPPWRHWMKFLILNGPNLNIMRWSEPGVPGELDYNAIMDYVQAGCEQLGIETDCCQTNHEGDLVVGSRNKSRFGFRTYVGGASHKRKLRFGYDFLFRL